jgi:hypothetical protein
MLLKNLCKKLLFAALVPALPFACVSVGLAQEASPVLALNRFAQYQGRYAVSFPITQAYRSQIHNQPNDMSVSADVDGACYAVVCVDMNEFDGNADKLFDDVETYAQRANHARMVRQAPLALRSFPGREVELENDNGFQRISRDYLVGRRLYKISAQAPARKLNREMALEFLDSFALLDGNAPAPVPAPSAEPAPAAPTIMPSAAPVVPMPAPQATIPSLGDHRYVNRRGEYFMELPGTPSESSTRPDPKGPELHSAELIVQGVGYFVTYFQMGSREMDWANVQTDPLAALFSLWKQDVVQNFHASVSYERHAQVAGRAGYEAEFVLPNGTHHVARMLMVGRRCYHIVVAGSDVTGEKPCVRASLDSFGIID